MTVKLPAIAALLFVAAACTREGEARGPEASDAGGDVVSEASVSAAVSDSLNDPTIVAIFDAANTADIETGELAATRGSTKEIREFGAMLARDHRMVRQSGRDLAAKLGVTPTPPANDASGKAHADALALLRSKSGRDFDKAFLDHEVAFHQSVIDAVGSTLLPAIRNAELKDLVVKVAPAFEAHRAAAANLRARIGN